MRRIILSLMAAALVAACGGHKPSGNAPDAICIAGETPKAAIIISQARELGIKVPFLGGDGLASSELWKIGGPAAEGTYVISYFHPSDQRPEVVRFKADFQKRYGRDPDVWAAQSYDALKVLAHAIAQAGSTDPAKIADALHQVKDWPGVTGPHTFDEKGDVVGKKAVITVVKNAAFELFEGVTPVASTTESAPAPAPASSGSHTMSGEIVVGLAGPMTGDLAQFGEAMTQGVMMAADELNAAGGVLGKKIRIEKGDDQAKPSEGNLVAQRFTGNKNIVAVIGHFNSGVSIPASAIYNHFGIVEITPASTNPKLTNQGFANVFRNLPTDDENGRQLADFASRRGFKRIAIYYANNAYGKGLADIFEERAKGLGIEIVDKQAYDPDREEDFRPVLRNWMAAGSSGA